MQRRRSGVILLLVSGVVVLLLLLAVALLGFARASSGFARGAMGAAAARLAASGGMEYAAARLVRRATPAPSLSPAGRGEDWICRDGDTVPLERLLNPSFSHGEGWLDAGSPDGAFSAGETAGPDRDGDRRFSAWSGRLRGGGDPSGLRFSLRIGSPEGKIPLNAGDLRPPNVQPDGIDNDWSGVADQPGEPGDFDGPSGAANGVPDHQDLSIPYHAGLASALNSLGTIRSISTPAIGVKLLTARPAGGFRSWERIAQALPAVPAGDWDAIRPFISLDIPEPSGEGSRCSVRNVLSAPVYAPVCLHAARREVLASLWLGLRVDSPFAAVPFSPQWLKVNDFAGEAAGQPVPCPPAHGVGTFGTAVIKIFQDEAEALADAVLRYRREGTASWKGLRDRWVAEAPTIFSADYGALAAAPVFRSSWVQSKAALAFQAAAVDPYPFRGAYCGLSTWAGWGTDRDGDAANGVQHPPAIGLERIKGSGVTACLPQGLTLAPPSRFSVEARGSAGGVAASFAGVLPVGERLELSSQEDFESLAGGRILAGRGISVADSPAPEVRHGCPAGKQADPVIVSVPQANRRSFGVTYDIASPPNPNPKPNVLKAPYFGFSRAYGALALAPLKGGRLQAGLYWPFREDLDASCNPLSPPPAWTGFWSEHDAALYATFTHSSLAGVKPPYRFPSPFPGNGEVPLVGSSSANPAYAFLVTPEASSPHLVSGKWGALGSLQPGVSNKGVGDIPYFVEPWLTYFPGNVTGVISTATIEAWMGPESQMALGDINQNRWLQIGTRRSWREKPGSPDLPGTEFVVSVRWDYGTFISVFPPIPPLAVYDSFKTWFVPDPQGAGSFAPGSYHVMLTLERQQVSPTDLDTVFTLYVNGSTASDDGPMTFRHDWDMKCHWWDALGIRSIDEFRLYKDLRGGEAAARYGAGRYVRKGTFISPLYSLDRDARLGEAQWTGIVPPGLKDASGAPLNPFVVEVEGYSDPAGALSLGRKAVGETPADVADLHGLFGAPVRSFRYYVTIDCSSAAGVLYETPIFESIWFTLQRKGAAPAWTAWSGK